jgi:hypothetical protein
MASYENGSRTCDVDIVMLLRQNWRENSHKLVLGGFISTSAAFSSWRTWKAAANTRSVGA